MWVLCLEFQGGYRISIKFTVGVMTMSQKHKLHDSRTANSLVISF